MNECDPCAVHAAADVAASVLAGQTSLLRACRRIASLRHRLGAVPQDILDPILAVESELDDIPDDASALRWETRALQNKLREGDEYLERVRPLLVQCFYELLEHLRSSPQGES